VDMTEHTDEHTDQHTDLVALRRLFDSTIEAWNRADAEAFGAAFTEDADYITFVGTHYRGRAKIADAHDALWRKYLKGSRLVGHITGIRFPTPDTAVLTAVGKVRRNRFSSAKPDKAQTYAAVRHDDGWRFTAFHNCSKKPLFEWISSRSEPRLSP
jgi:uncharacterized protein (TIGR02246 family)